MIPTVNPPKVTCPCGQSHAGEAWELCVKLVHDFGELITVTIESRSWRVPRVWIGMHGLKAEDLPALAEKFGWIEVSKKGDEVCPST